MTSSLCGEQVVWSEAAVDATTTTFRARPGPLLMMSIVHPKPRPPSTVESTRIAVERSAEFWARATVAKRGKRRREREKVRVIWLGIRKSEYERPHIIRPSMERKIAVIPGDGIGPEVI